MKKLFLLCLAFVVSSNMCLYSQSFEKTLEIKGASNSGVFANDEQHYYFLETMGLASTNRYIQKMDVQSGKIMDTLKYFAKGNLSGLEASQVLNLMKKKSQIYFKVDNKILFFDTKTDKFVDSLIEQVHIDNVSISLDENVISYSVRDSDQTYIKSFNLTTKKYEYNFVLIKPNVNPQVSICINYDNGIVLKSGRYGGGTKSTISVVSMDDLSNDTTFLAVPRPITKISYSNDRKYLAISTDNGALKIFDANDYSVLNELFLPNVIDDFQFMCNPNYIIINKNNDSSNVYIYSMSESKIIFTLSGKAEMRNLIISEKNNYIAFTENYSRSSSFFLYRFIFEGVTAVENDANFDSSFNLDENNIWFNSPNSEFISCEIYDYSGIKYSANLFRNNINIAGLKSGVYFLILNGMNSSRIVKFVK